MGVPRMAVLCLVNCSPSLRIDSREGSGMATFLVRLTNRRSVKVEATMFEDSEDGKWITFVELLPVRGRGDVRTEQVRRFRSEAVREIERVPGRGAGSPRGRRPSQLNPKRTPNRNERRLEKPLRNSLANASLGT